VQIISLYRITSHNQVVEVDDASTSPNKVSNQVMVFEQVLPDSTEIKKFINNTSVGILLVVDTFNLQSFGPFDSIFGAEAKLKVLNPLNIDSVSAVLCLPDDFLTFYIGQQLEHKAKNFTIKIVTLSDRAHRGIYQDLSGPRITELVKGYYEQLKKKVTINNIIIPDNADELSHILEESKHEETDIIITTGGTGIGPRDITVETVKSHLDKEIPGIMEMIRVKYGAEKPNALLSRAIAGTMHRTLVYTLPGSIKAIDEYLTEILKTLDHLTFMVHGIDNH